MGHRLHIRDHGGRAGVCPKGLPIIAASNTQTWRRTQAGPRAAWQHRKPASPVPLRQSKGASAAFSGNSHLRPSSPLASSSVPVLRVRPSAVGHRYGDQDLIRPGRVVHGDGHAVEVGPDKRGVLVTEGDIDRVPHPSQLFDRRDRALPPPTASRRGVPSFGWRRAAACSYSPCSPTIAAFP